MTDAERSALAARLAGSVPDEIVAVAGSGNNRLYRVRAGAATYALKLYAGTPDESRERYLREFAGLTFLWRRGERRIAEPLALDVPSQAALYGWLPGEPGGGAQAADVGQMADFAGALFVARTDPAAAALAEAREAVFSGAMLRAQIAVRIARLRAVEDAHPELQPLLADIERETERRFGQQPPDEPLAAHRRTLSPSDFGTHNAIRTPAGLAFVDFEYFGWDDPVKLVADVLWHPGMGLDAPARQAFFAAASAVYGGDPGFAARFERDAPAYGLRWALIVLGEFLPDVWQRRREAGAAADAPAARARQLTKAAALVERARRGAVTA